jgi:hypothetical protein
MAGEGRLFPGEGRDPAVPPETLDPGLRRGTAHPAFLRLSKINMSSRFIAPIVQATAK